MGEGTFLYVTSNVDGSGLMGMFDQNMICSG
jgi:hypothetical protein